jgi:hypothetical protein
MFKQLLISSPFLYLQGPEDVQTVAYHLLFYIYRDLKMFKQLLIISFSIFTGPEDVQTVAYIISFSIFTGTLRWKTVAYHLLFYIYRT